MTECNKKFKDRWFSDRYSYDHIYHFTSVDSLMKILLTNTFRLSNVSTMNDINESIPNYKRTFVDGERLDNIEEIENKMRNGTFLGCFNVLEKDENIRNKVSMWGHYANGGRGVCLKINKKKLDELLFNEGYDIKNDAIKSQIHISKLKIKYINQEEINKMKKYYLSRVNDAITVYYSTLEWLFGCKSDDWSPENEFRYLVFDWDANGKSFFTIKDFNQCIDSIYIGDNQDKGSIELLMAIKNKLAKDIVFYIRNDNLEEFPLED